MGGGVFSRIDMGVILGGDGRSARNRFRLFLGLGGIEVGVEVVLVLLTGSSETVFCDESI
jgi:hypothetical protein